jgi:hypothetical protein
LGDISVVCSHCGLMVGIVHITRLVIA